jgi:lysozyme
MADKILLVDVSHWQGVMDWNKAISMGVRGAFIKASEGNTWRDPQFARNWQECRRLNLAWAMFHYFLPTLSPANQALHFNGMEEGLDPPLGMAGDFEQPTSASMIPGVAGKALSFMEQIDPTTLESWVYSSPWYTEVYLQNLPQFANYRLWLANYTDEPTIPPAWGRLFDDPKVPDIRKIWVWQFTSAGHGYGEARDAKAIDLDYLMFGRGFATEAHWNMLSGGVKPVVEVPFLFKAVCIKEEGVDTRNEAGVDIKQDLHFGDLVSVYEIKGGMQRIDPVIQRWVTTSTNYMLPLKPPVPPDPLTAGVRALFEQYHASLE